jgi:hypothetical protein
MRELNPIGREGDSLLLVTSDGERFTLPVDETLVRTIKEHRVPDTNTNQLSPRQIQDAIRSGVSITELAETSGTSLDLIERFAHPVLEELLHMVNLAKSVRVEQAADRFNEVIKKPFGELIEERLSQSNAQVIKWSAKRGENAIWEVSVSFTKNNETGLATWSFDPRKYLLTPETTLAANLSNSNPKLDGLLGPTTISRTLKVESPEDVTVISEDNLLAFRSRRNQVQEVEAPVEVEPLTGDVPEEKPVDSNTEVFEEVGGIEPYPSEVPEDLIETAPEQSESEPDTVKPAEPKKVRAPMPSWDQIVRGTQSDDGEAF